VDGTVDVYDQNTPATVCGWVRTSAVRMALVTRNSQLEKSAVTTGAPVWDGGPASGVLVAPAGSANTPIDLSAFPKWQNYRYKIFQTTVPLRNVTWMGGRAGC
jgi:type IV pilus assembly protein PilW